MTDSKRVLLIEDDEFIANAYMTGFEKSGLNVTLAETAEKAVETLEAEDYDLILLDILLPSQNGFDFLEEFKQSKKKDVPVIIISNLGQPDDIERGKSLGAADYIVKAENSLRQVIDKTTSFFS